MRILVFTSQIRVLGGAERLAVELVEGLNKRAEVHADLLIMEPEGIAGNDIARKRLLENGVSVSFLNLNSNSNIIKIIKSHFRLRRILKEGNYNIIETSMRGPSILTAWAVRGLQSKHVTGIHTIYKLSKINIMSMTFIWKWSCKLNRSTSFYAISNAAARAWEDYVDLPSGSVNIIYNSVHPEYFEAKYEKSELCKDLKIDDHVPLLLFVGRLTLGKGLDTLIDAVAPLCKSGKCNLLLVGGPNDKLLSEFGETENFLSELKERTKDISDRILWLGWRNDVPQLMAASDLLIHPSRHEGFGLVLAEALATGLPIVASNVGGIPEVLRGTDSILIPPNRPDLFRSAICQLLTRTAHESGVSRQRSYSRAKDFLTDKRIDNFLIYFQNIIHKSQSKK